ncbi:UNKNOWN [Stylonychia lemnae]|uniref:Transmembrane protein n=1 Tax=Stylonychia lemnae TaxID=5949 RepID=A0A078AJK3_STYLE|nr:UNKNOWN [Stylonychia lemnae]|eukprot:CDW82066.1 UNKNOWN [Stylonychia lemnae]
MFLQPWELEGYFMLNKLEQFTLQIQLSQIITQDQSSFFNNMSAFEGGSIYCYNCFISLESSYFESNYASDGENITVINTFAAKGGVFSIKMDTLYLIISNITVENAGAVEGGVFFIWDITSLILSNITANRLFVYNDYTFLTIYGENSYFHFSDVNISGGSNLLDEDQLWYLEGSILSNQRFQGTTMLIYQCSQNFSDTNSTYTNTAAIQGGFMFSQGSTTYLDNCTFINSRSLANGGFMYSYADSSWYYPFFKVIIVSSIFNKIYGQSSGGAFYLDNVYLSLEIIQSQFSDIKSDIDGGIFFVNQLRSDIIIRNNCSFADFRVNYFMDQGKNIGGSLFYIKNAAKANFTQVKLENAFGAKYGGILQAISTQIYIIKSEFSNIFAINGGILYQLNSTVFIESSSFSSIKSQYGGIFYANDHSFIQAYNSIFENTEAEDRGGIISVQLESNQNKQPSGFAYFDNKKASMSILTSEFKNIRGYYNGGLFLSLNIQSMTIDQSTFQNLFSNRSSILDSSSQEFQLAISNSKFICDINFDTTLVPDQLNTTNPIYNNEHTIKISKAQYVNLTKNSFKLCGVTSEGGVFSISDTTLIDNGSTYDSNYAIQGGVIQVMEGSKDQNITFTRCIFESNFALKNTISVLQANMLIEDSQFLQNTATERSKNIFAGFSSIYIFDTIFRGIDILKCQFSDNHAFQEGGAIFSSGFEYLNILQDSKFQNNRANETGDDIYVTNTLGKLLIENTNFKNPGASLSIYAANLALSMSKVTMTDIGIENEVHQYGSALYCLDCKTILISDSEFKNMKSYLGGAFYIEELTQNKVNSLQSAKYLIQNSNFAYCRSVTGGALFLLNVEKMQISNSKFVSNEVVNSTADNYYKYHGSGGAIYFECTDQNYNCELTINGNSEFKNNFATRQGGAIHWESLEPIMSGDVLFQNNLAIQYGNDLSCFAQRIIKIDQDTYSKIMQQLGIESRRLRSLQQNYTYSSELIVPVSAQIESQRSGGTMPIIYIALVDKYGQIIGIDQVSKSQFFVLGGVVQIQNIQFTGTPGYQYGLVLTTDGIDIKKKSNKEYLSNTLNQSQSDIDFKIEVQLRECEIGEQFTVAGKCEECQQGNSFSLVKMIEPGQCQTCPTDKARCYGGTNIGPKYGYWRKNNMTSYFVQCLYLPACLGMLPPIEDPRGTCLQGYRGILCADCLKGYSRQGDFKCQECPGEAVNSIRLGAIFIALILMIVFVVRSTLLGAKEKKNVTSIYLKIMMNHLQLIILCSSFNFEWPKLLIDFYTEIKPVAQVSTQIFSFDCFIDKREDNEGSDQIEIDIFRIFFQKLVILAVLPIILTICSWLFWVIFQKIKYSQEKYIGKVITTLIILLFLVHPNIVQYMFSNFKYARQKLGFLYRGYRKKYHYWEIIIMYRKILLIFISVFVSAFGVMAQALIVFLVFILFLIVNLKTKPFSTIALNDLETVSLVTSMVTIYCGLFFISNTKQSQIDLDPELSNKALQLSDNVLLALFAIILISNCIFFFYWLYKMLFEVRGKIMRSIPKLYLFLCSCNNQQKFQRGLRQLQIDEENETLREEFNKKKLQIYLDPQNILNMVQSEKQNKIIDQKIERLLKRDKKNQKLGSQIPLHQVDSEKQSNIISESDIFTDNCNSPKLRFDFKNQSPFKSENICEEDIEDEFNEAQNVNKNNQISQETINTYEKKDWDVQDIHNMQQVIHIQRKRLKNKSSRQKEGQQIIDRMKALVMKNQTNVRSPRSPRRNNLLAGQNDLQQKSITIYEITSLSSQQVDQQERILSFETSPKDKNNEEQIEKFKAQVLHDSLSLPSEQENQDFDENEQTFDQLIRKGNFTMQSVDKIDKDSLQYSSLELDGFIKNNL